MPKPHDMEKRQLAKTLFLEGLRTEAIAARTGVPCASIRSWKRRGRWEDLRLAVRQQLAVPGRAALAVARDLAAESQTVREKLSAVVKDQATVLGEVNPGRDPAKVHRRAQALRETVNAAATVYGWNTQDQLAAWSMISKRQPEVKRVSQDGTVQAAPDMPPPPQIGDGEPRPDENAG